MGPPVTRRSRHPVVTRLVSVVLCEHYCSLRVGKVVGTCLAAAASQLLWYEAHDAVRRQGLRYLSADITGPALPLTINSTIVTIVFGLLLALALDTLLQYASHALHCTALHYMRSRVYASVACLSVRPSVSLSVCPMRPPHAAAAGSVRENVCNNSKNVKSHVF